jgi:ubiquinone/menaquinone biosynthesis C-methylase UbiE
MQFQIRQRLGYIARKFRLIDFLDLILFCTSILRTGRRNSRFMQENHNFSPPPLRWLYDSTGSTDYRGWIKHGAEHARYIYEIIKKYRTKSCLHICDWGCGPGRVIRHLPHFFADKKVLLTGIDYNRTAIEYCKRSIPEVNFLISGLLPPLAVVDASFDIVYAISVFTHLSEKSHYLWTDEIHRILKPGGVLIATFHDYDDKMLPIHKELYRAGKLVVRGGSKEGRKMYTSFHPATFLEKLFSNFLILEKETFLIPGWLQKFWVVQKPCFENR